MEWNYYDTSHGKRAHDGVGDWLKQALQKEQLKPHGIPLQNA